MKEEILQKISQWCGTAFSELSRADQTDYSKGQSETWILAAADMVRLLNKYSKNE